RVRWPPGLVDDCRGQSIVKQRPVAQVGVVIPGWMDAVGKEDGEEVALGIDPKRGAGKAGVAEAVRARQVAAGACFRSLEQPSEAARLAGNPRGVTAGRGFKGGAAEDARHVAALLA